MTNSLHFRTLVLLGGTLGVVGCGDGVLSPSLRQRPSTAALVTITAEVGQSMLLDPSTGIVTDGEGHAIQLTAEQTAAALAAYEDEEVAASYLIAWAPVLETTSTCQLNGNGCAQVRLNPPGGKRSPYNPHFDGQYRIEPVRDAQGRRTRRARTSADEGGDGRSMLRADGLHTVDFIDGWTCADISRAVWELREQTRAGNQNLAGSLWGALKGYFGALSGGSLPTPLSALQGAAVDLEMTVAGSYFLRVQMEQYSAWARELQCWGVPYYGGTAFEGYQYSGGGGPPTGSFHRECEMELWRWSLDGGATWQTKWIETCELVFVPFQS